MILKTNKTEDESIVSIDDQMHPAANVLVDVFYFGEVFSHHQLTTAKQERVIDGHPVSYDGKKVLLDNKPFEQANSTFIIVKPTDYQTIATSKPKKDFTISSSASSAISLPTAAFVSVTVEAKPTKYSVDIYANEETIYFNGHRVTKGKFDFSNGNQLVIDKLIIEVRDNQLKLTNLGSDVKLNPFEIIEQSYEPEYPSEFPLFRRSPRIHLKEPKMDVEVMAPIPKEKEGKNELLRTLVPPLGMVVLTGATSFLSGGNPIMMLSMGGASLLTAGFSVSSYFTNKKETNEKNERSEGSYRQYLIQKKGDISLLQQEQEYALTYMYPSMNDLALMAKDYEARIYERMTTNEDFLKVHVGTGEIQSSFAVKYQSNEESELSLLAEKELVWPYQQLESAPIVIPLMDQTVGLAGNYPVLRTAIQTLLFQISMLHSYRDVEFVTLVPENDYDLNWHAWRWLPHLKIRSLNLRGIIHNAQTRDMVLNSFYQILTKRRQELKEAGNEKVRFQPHYVFSILEESWLSGHGLNEFLAEDMSPYGVTVIWGKDALPMLPETTTTLIDYQSSESAILINQNNEYVNQSFVPTHLPTAYPIEEALQRLANLHHVEVEKNAVPESLDLLEQYEVKRIEELKIKTRWLDAEPNKSIRSLIGWRGKSDFVYWDLHERAHGPHALVGGTTGSGKSEFLTTYLIGLAINFSPEDIGMLIIDWKGGGIANTLDKLPHFMGAITNLDGAGTARALASIKAELNKRQREFAKYGVNNINGYMSLYKQRNTPKPDVVYPTKPLPHLILVSDEFAELKANVPEFLDELTSVARIGRSLGVHLILATQKPSGVVNDQIEANSTSKIALKMASVQDSNELLKTPDAAQITNPGRGYLKVGENEVYELFQSGYAGVLYDPDKTMEEVVDERIFKINDLGQTELLYDPDEEIVQGKDTSDLPTQLEAVIETIEQIFEQSEFTIPDKPWLPNLSEQLTTPTIEEAEQRNVTIPLGLLDIPSEQAQKIYHYNLEKASHTAIFSSPGYGKSTLLQTLIMNLAHQNTPEQVQLNLLDFGNNGLLPLKDLPHVADIVTLEEDEKLQKMLDRISGLLAERKGSFKKNGVASIMQYEAKTNSKLPIIANVLDGYDGLSLEDNRKDKIDEVLLQLLRDGASLGVYLIVTASRSGSIRMNMMSNIATKIALYLNDETELSTLLGRETLAPQAINGRGQVMLDTPTAVQFYLPIQGEDSSDLLENLEKEVTRMNHDWTGKRPEKIPMVPEELTIQNFSLFVKEMEADNLYLGLNKLSSLVEKFPLFQGKSLGIFTASNKQFRLMMPWFMQLISDWKEDKDVILIDAAGTLEENSTNVSTYIDRMQVTQQNFELKESLEAMLLPNSSQRVVLINGVAELVDKLFLNPEEVAFLLNGGTNHLQLIFIDSLSKVGNSYGGLTNMVKESVHQILFGGSLQNQLFIENLPYTQKNVVVPRNVLHSLKDDVFEDIVVPMEVGE